MEQTLLLLNFEKTLQLCVESFLGVHSLLVTLYDKLFPLIKKITVKSFQQYLFVTKNFTRCYCINHIRFLISVLNGFFSNLLNFFNIISRLVWLKMHFKNYLSTLNIRVFQDTQNFQLIQTDLETA